MVRLHRSTVHRAYALWACPRAAINSQRHRDVGRLAQLLGDLACHAIRQARSRPVRPIGAAMLCRGKITVTSAPGSSASWRIRSTAHPARLRPGQSTNSSGT